MPAWQIVVALLLVAIWFLIVHVAPCIDNYGRCGL